MKGIIYTRVSSDEQVKGTSLETQKDACIQYCKDKGIEVEMIFCEEGESAKTIDRKEFLSAIDYCRKNTGKIEAFVVWKLDRFSRNAEAHFEVKAMLSRFNVTLHSVTEPIGNDPSQRLFETILAGFSEFDNAIRRQRSMNGMAAKLKQGLWPWNCPMGYKSHSFKKRGFKKTAPDLPDERVFPILQKALREYSKGLCSQADIAKMLEDDGLNVLLGTKKISLQTIDLILGKQLPFYAGLLTNPWPHPSGEDKFIQGLHTPMITLEAIHRIQMIRSGKHTLYKYNRLNPLFPLKRTVLCSEGNKPLTGSSPRGNGGIYHYYHCYRVGCSMKAKIISTEKLEKDFLEYLKKITPTEKFLRVFKASVIDYWSEQGAQFEFKAEQFKTQLATLEKQRKNIFEMREEGNYTIAEFKERRDEIDSKITAIKISYSEARIEQFDIESAVDYASAQIRNLPRLWKELLPETKARFQKLVFPEGISYHKEKGFGTAKLGCIYEISQQFNADLSPVVPPAGFEPATVSLR